MADWIHCNKCFLKYQQKIKFYVTTCGHLNCKNCVSRIGPEKQCLICSSVCDTTELSNNLQPDIQRFFRPYNQLSDTGSQIFSFQYSNAASLQNNTIKKYTAVKGEITKCYKATLEIKKQNAILRERISSLQRGGFTTSTPAPHAASAFTNTPPAATPIRNISSKYGQTENSTTSFTPRNQSNCIEGMHKQRQIPHQMTSSHSLPIFRNSVVSSPASYTQAIPRREFCLPENPTMVSMSRLGFGSNNKI